MSESTLEDMRSFIAGMIWATFSGMKYHEGGVLREFETAVNSNHDLLIRFKESGNTFRIETKAEGYILESGWEMFKKE